MTYAREMSQDFSALDAWWRAANYLSVGQIYLKDNPLLREPLTIDHVNTFAEFVGNGSVAKSWTWKSNKATL